MTPATGYETLIYDCLTGDQTLFQRADNIERLACRAAVPRCLGRGRGARVPGG